MCCFSLLRWHVSAFVVIFLRHLLLAWRCLSQHYTEWFAFHKAVHYRFECILHADSRSIAVTLVLGPVISQFCDHRDFIPFNWVIILTVMQCSCAGLFVQLSRYDGESLEMSCAQYASAFSWYPRIGEPLGHRNLHHISYSPFLLETAVVSLKSRLFTNTMNQFPDLALHSSLKISIGVNSIKRARRNNLSFACCFFVCLIRPHD